MGFEKVVELVLQFVGLFQFFDVVDAYERAVVLRFGKYNRTLEPGFHFVWPGAVERVIKMNVVFDTIDLGVQSCTTKDGKSVVVNAYLSHEVFDVKRALLDVDGVEGVLLDVASGYIEESIAESTWNQVRRPEFRKDIKTHVQKKARKMGIAVKNIQFSDCVATRSLRIWNNPTTINTGSE